MISAFGIDHSPISKGLGYSPLRTGYGVGRGMRGSLSAVKGLKHIPPESRAPTFGEEYSDDQLKRVPKEMKRKEVRDSFLDRAGVGDIPHAKVGHHLGFHRDKYLAGAAATGAAGAIAGAHAAGRKRKKH